MPDVTRILSQIESGDRHAADELLPLVYEELRKLPDVELHRRGTTRDDLHRHVFRTGAGR